jgi:hypothetical protein
MAEDIADRVRSAFDGEDVARKNIALRQAHDHIARLRAALRHIESRTSDATAAYTAREALGDHQR